MVGLSLRSIIQCSAGRKQPLGVKQEYFRNGGQNAVLAEIAFCVSLTTVIAKLVEKCLAEMSQRYGGRFCCNKTASAINLTPDNPSSYLQLYCEYACVRG